MALSEQEQRLLQQLEASLVAEDPKLADTLRGGPQVRVQKRRAALAGLGFLVGLAGLIAGVQSHPAVSVVGFIVMLVSAIAGLSAWTKIEGSKQPATPKRKPPKASASDFMDKLEERWRRRRQEDD